MLRVFLHAALLLISVQLTASEAPSGRASDIEAVARKAADLGTSGHCKEALPQLGRAMGHVQDPDLKRKVGIAGVRCSMSLNDAGHATSFLIWLNREFPHDPAVLYLSTHVYSDLSIRASNELLSSAPGSPEVHELNAEALETMGKWKEAAEEYRAVLVKDPQMPGIHYRLGRLLLSQPDPPANVKDEARHEFEEELRIDPANAGANFVLGELARQAENWPQAIDYFAKATKYDTSFAEAYLGLGRAYMGAEKPAEAIPPLEMAVKLQGDNPETHFQLATAYRRAGRKADADREFLAHRDAAQKADAAKDELKRQVSGVGPTPASQATTPNQ